MTSSIVEVQPKNESHDIVTNIDSEQMMTIRQFCAVFPWPTEAAMRSYCFRSKELCLSDAFVRVGRRVLVIPKTFFRLIKQLESRSTAGGEYGSTTWRTGKAHP